MKIITIIKKGMPVFAIQMKVGDLDKSKLSSKFLSHDFDDDMVVNVKCFEDGSFDLRGKKQEYRIIQDDNYRSFREVL